MSAAQIDGLRQRTRSAGRALDRRRGEMQAVKTAAATTDEEIQRLSEEIELNGMVGTLLNSFAEDTHTALQKRIEAIVTHGLRMVMGEELSFHVTTSRHGKTAATDLTIRSIIDGCTVETDIMSARGGGVAAVAGALLRLTVMLLTPSIRPTLLLDETFAQLSEDKVPALIEFITELVQRTRAQVIIVTHTAPEEWTAAADKAYRLSNVRGKTKVEVLK